MVQSRLGRAVRECFERGDAQAVDAANVDYTRGVRGGRRSDEERGEELREREDAREVEGQDACPCRGGVGGVGRAPVGTAVVHQYIELCLTLASPRSQRREDVDVLRTPSPFLELVGELLQIFLLVEIRRDEVGFPFSQRIQLRTSLFARGGVARGYIDVCAVGHEAFADHAADAFCATGYEDDFALRMGLVMW
jgi:hypothetical protein